MSAELIPPAAQFTQNTQIPGGVRLQFDGTNAELYLAEDIHGAGRDAIILSTADTIVLAAAGNGQKRGYVQMGTSSGTYEYFLFQHNGNASAGTQTPGSKKLVFGSYYWSGGVGTNYRAMSMRHKTSAAGVGTMDFFANETVGTTTGETDAGTHIFSIREGVGAYFPTGYGLSFADGSTVLSSGGRVKLSGQPAVCIDFNSVYFMEHFIGGTNTDGQIGQHGWRIYNTAGTGAQTYVLGEDGYPGIFRIASGANSGDGQQLALSGTSLTTTRNITSREFYITAKARVNSTTSIKWRLGFGNGTGTEATRYFGIRYDTTQGDTNYMVVAYNADGTENDAVSLGVAADTNFHVFEMEYVSSTSMRARCDSGSWQTVSSEMPTNQFLTPFMYVQTQTTAARSADLDLFAFTMKTA